MSFISAAKFYETGIICSSSTRNICHVLLAIDMINHSWSSSLISAGIISYQASAITIKLLLTVMTYTHD